MKRYELTISTGYVPTWGIVEAIRELFQNAIDEEKRNPDHSMDFKYDESTGILKVINKNSSLDISSLILGSSSKTDDKTMIGNFGEGYKIATMVLLRNNKGVTFYNGDTNQVWKTKLYYSSRYEYKVELPIFMVYENHPKSTDLIIEVSGITLEEYYLIKESNLYLQEINSSYETPYGSILLDPRHKGKLYVSGLYVCTHNRLNYGYNVNPEDISLDRDRKLVSDIDLSWITSKMWMSIKDNSNNDIKDRSLSIVEEFDGQYTKYFTTESYSSDLVDKFIKDHGENSYPVVSQDQAELAKSSGYSPVIVSDSYREILLSSKDFAESFNLKSNKISDRLDDLKNRITDDISEEDYDELENIIYELKKKGL